MGKDKRVTANRTKGNQKPSSSGRTAELLGGVTGFVGFNALKDPGYVPAATQCGNQEDDSSISAEFRVSMRKMSKKDGMTKIKALQEFECLCSSEDLESVKSALPFWPRIYAKLSFDSERRVRETAQVAHAALVAQVGKCLAPHLKSIMPSWILSMVDTHTPASLIAVKTFQAAFAEDKRAGVMVFCAKAVFDSVTDNLYEQTAETVADLKTSVVEENESRYARLVSCSLKSVCLLLSYMSTMSEKRPEIVAALQPLIQNQNFWKLAKHQNVHVRTSWFSLVKDLLEFEESLLQDFTVELSKAILSALDDKEGAVVTHSWMAFFHLCITMPDFWEKSGANPKSVFGRLYSVIREGARGSAADLYPQLLPIISVIPPKAMGDQKQFYVDFFKAISTGLRKEQVLSSNRDVSAVIKALVECIKYVSFENATLTELWNIVIKYQLVELLVDSFVDSTQLGRSILYAEIASLLRFWVSKSASDGSGDTIPLNEMAKHFWNLFIPEAEKIIEHGDCKQVRQLETFVETLRHPDTKSARRVGGIQFADEVGSKQSVVDSMRPEYIGQDVKEKGFIDWTSLALVPLVGALNTAYSQHIDTNVYSLMATCLEAFGCQESLALLVDDDFSYRQVVESVAVPKLDSYDTEVVNPAVKIFVTLYDLMDEEERRVTMGNLKSNLSGLSVKLLLQSMCDRSAGGTVAQWWLMSPQLGCRLVRLCQQLCGITAAGAADTCSGDDCCYRELVALMQFVLSNAKKKESKFATVYVSQILTTLRTILPQSGVAKSNPDINASVCLVAELAITFYSNVVCWTVPGCFDFSRALLSVICCRESVLLSDNAAEQVERAFMLSLEQWLTVIVGSDLSKLMSDGGLLLLVMNDLKNFAINQDTSLQHVSAMADVAVIVMRCVAYHFVRFLENNEAMVSCFETPTLGVDLEELQIVLDSVVPSTHEWEQLEEGMSALVCLPLALRGVALKNHSWENTTSISREEMWSLDHVRAALFIAPLMLFVCQTREKMFADVADAVKVLSHVDQEATVSTIGTTRFEEPVSLGIYTDVFVCMLHSLCHVSAMVQLHQSIDHDIVANTIKIEAGKLEKTLKSIFSHLNVGNKRLIMKQICDRCVNGSDLWLILLDKVVREWMSSEDVDACKLALIFQQSSADVTQLAGGRQVLLPLFPENALLILLEEELGVLASLSEDPSARAVADSLAVITTAVENMRQPLSDDMLSALFGIFGKWREGEDADDLFLFSANISDHSLVKTQLAFCISRLCSVLVQTNATGLLHMHWDFILCSLTSWVQTLGQSIKGLFAATPSTAMFAISVCDCLSFVGHLLYVTPEKEEVKCQYPPSLFTEWQEFFSTAIYEIIFSRYVSLSYTYAEKLTPLFHAMMSAFSKAAYHTPSRDLIGHKIYAIYHAGDANEFKLPNDLLVLLNHLTSLLKCQHISVQCTAKALIGTALPNIMQQWESLNQVPINDDEDTPQRPLPFALTRVLEETSPIVESYLSSVEIGIGCSLVPCTYEHTYTVGYLLGWNLCLDCLDLCHEDQQQMYSTYLRETGLLFPLFNNLFKLMPAKPILPKKTANNKETNEENELPATLFTTSLDISPLGSEHLSGTFLAHLACHIYLQCVNSVPATVRQWWLALDRRTQQIVDKFTLTYVSPILIGQEMRAVNNSTLIFDNMIVKARPVSREVIATYTIDEVRMELVLRLGVNHPLSTVIIEDQGRVGVSLTQWRNWLLGLNRMLSHRNTPLLQSLSFWKQNVDQKFQGLEECYICYYVLHGTNHQLPKLLCRTCKKKFHSACLYKWFSTSNNSTCPICRSLF